MGFCGLLRRKRVQNIKANEKTNNYGDEKPKQPSQANHPTFAAHQRQRQNLSPRPVINTRNSNFSQGSTLDTPATPPPLYQSRPQSSHHDGFLPLIKQQSPFRGIPEITVSTGLNSHRPGSSTTSNTYQNSLAPIVDTTPPTLRNKLASRPESFDANYRPSSLRPSTASVVESITTSNSSPRVSLDPPAPATRPQFNTSQDFLGRLSPAPPPIPRVSSKRLRPASLPHSAQPIPSIRRQSPNNIAGKPIRQAPSIPPLPKFGGLGSLRVPPSQSSGVHRSDTVASRYNDEGLLEEEDGDWTPPVPGLNMDAYMDLVGQTPYEIDEMDSALSDKPEVLVARSHSYTRGGASSRASGEVDAPAIRVGGFGRSDSVSKERRLEEEDRIPEDARNRYLERLTDVPAIKVVSVLQRPDAAERQASAEKRWGLRTEQGGSPMDLPVPTSNVEKRMSAPTPVPLRVMRSSGLIVDVPVLNKYPRPLTKQERKERGKLVNSPGGRR